MSKQKDPNSVSGKIRELIKAHPHMKGKDIAQLAGSSIGLVYQVKMAMQGKRKKVVNAKPKPMRINAPELPITMEEDEAFNTITITANSTQVAGNHYKQKAIQPWDYITSNNLGYLEGNVVKYVSRWQDKGGVEDLKKAQHYLAKLIEVNE